MKFLFQTDDVRKFVLIGLCTLCFISTLPRSCASRLQCFMGRVSTTERASFHLVNCTTPPTVRPITTCLHFKYQTNADGSQNDTRLTYGGVGGDQFACDKDHHCDGSSRDMKSWIRNVTYNGRSGDLYCCLSSRCNDPRAVVLAQTNVPCFVGSTTPNGTSGTLQPCSTEQCLNITHGDVTEHRCDTEGLCNKHQLAQECRRITDGDVSKLLCCCDQGNKGCNIGNIKGALSTQHPPLQPTTMHHHLVAHLTRDQPTVRPMEPMPPGIGPGKAQEQKSQVAGIVSAAVLGTALVVLVVVIGLKQWQRYREKYNFSYMQLTADMMVL